MTAIGPHSRAADERLLEWLRLRVDGVPMDDIGAAHGFSRSRVWQATNNVRKADIDHCGLSVVSAYW